jgi:alpha-amylase/alpha-mannosidase (GH57 family)
MKYVCVHGHFYQPPRENPSLEAIELQDSAYPYHDWNERVTAECYSPNAKSRLLDDQQRIVELVNNYARISFDFGPTLLLWMQQKGPQLLESIREADRQSQERFGGHGSAMAQAYNHMIMPLAHPRDKETQVIWGKRDFATRFGRQPEGMWLPETAVDLPTLEALAAQGIRFTILAPRQAKRVRRHGSRSWKDVSGDRIDPSRAYQVRLPSGKTMALFFYDGPISQAVAFEGLLNDGKRFADRILGGFSDQRSWPQLCHIATDGESYGHHHHHGEMALTYALQSIEKGQAAKLTNYGQFLEMHPPDHWVEISENTSWSCVHGVERWKANCGCNSGGRDGWNQEWRAPLRSVLDWLRDALVPVFEQHCAELLRDPWAARNDYIDVILDRSPETLANFLAAHATHELNDEERVRTLKLLEMQRHAMLMYTSCGWFFDELSGLETVQVLHYAGRALQLACEAAGNKDLEQGFCEKLRDAKSNIPEHGNGEEIYKKWIAPAVVTPDRVTGHYAVSELFEAYGDQTRIYCYDVAREQYSVETEGKMRLAVGRVRVRSEITVEEKRLEFAVLHLGDHNITGGVREFRDENRFEQLHGQLDGAFAQADTAQVIRIFDEHFGKSTYSIRSLFRDEQRRIIGLILQDTLSAAAASFRGMYENQAALIRFLNSLNVPVPGAFLSVAEIALNGQLQQAIERPDVDPAAVQALLREADVNQVKLDATTLEYKMRKRLEEQATVFHRKPDLDALKRLHSLLDVAGKLPFHVGLATVQEISFEHLVHARVNGNGNAVAAAAGNGQSGANDGAVVAPTQAISDAPHQEWSRELSAVREKLSIQGPQ